jgi:hypothetical protein
MKSLGALAGAVALSALMALGAACSDDSGKSKTPVSSPTVSTQALANVTPFPTPLISGNQLVSSNKGYSATFPAGWKVRANFVQTADSSVDAIFEPLPPGANAQANIAIYCIVTKSPSDAERVEFMKTNTARQGLNKDIQVSQRKVAGADATVLSYRFVSENSQTTPELDKQDMFFSGPKCDYTVTTTVLAGQREKYAAGFEQFINSFTLIP